MTKPRYFLRTEDDRLVVVQDEDPSKPTIVPPQVARPVLVLDPTDTEQIMAFLTAMIDHSSDPGVRAYLPDMAFGDMQGAIYSMLSELDQPVPSDQLPPDSPFRA